MSYLHLIILKFLDHIWNLIGRLIRLSQVQEKLDLFDIEEIVIHRADRLGDAVLSRPFLQATLEYFRLLGWQGRVTILASSYNVSLLETLQNIPNVGIKIIRTGDFAQYDRSFIRAIQNFVQTYQRYKDRLRIKTRNRTICIDLVDSVSEMSLQNLYDYRNALWISSNRGPFSLLFDRIASTRFAGSSDQNLTENYISLFESTFDLPGFQKAINTRSDLFYPKSTPPIVRTILIHVGVKEIRNFEPHIWQSILEEISEKFSGYRIEVVDLAGSTVLASLRTMRVWRPNMVFRELSFSLDEFIEYAKRFSFVIGIDGGGINMIRSLTNSLTIFTFGNAAVWSAYRIGKAVEHTRLGNGWVLDTIQVREDRAMYTLRKKSFWLPSFQIPFDRSFVSDVPVKEFITELLRRSS